MEMYAVLQLIHVIAATIWVGGHIILLISLVPDAVKRRDMSLVAEFEKRYGMVLGLPSLLIAGATGIAMAHRYHGWFSESWPIGAKIALFTALILIILLGRHELHRLRGKEVGEDSRRFAIHVLLVTAVSLMLVVMGWHLRFGLF